MTAAGSVAFLLMSELIGALVVLLFTEPARYILKKLWAIVPFAKDKIFEFLAPRFPDRIGVPGYRKRVARSPVLSRIENPVGPEELQGSVLLDQAFAPLSVTTGHSQDRVDLFEFSVNHSRFLV